MRQIFIVCIAIISGLCSYGQDCKFVLSGHIEDADTKEKLSAATISIKELNIQFITDVNGDFRYQQICPGTYEIQVSHAGCETVTKTVTVNKNIHLDILLPHLRHNLQEVVVEAQKPVPNYGFRQQLDKRTLEQSKTASFAEALSRINGVSLLQTGSTISKPVIHGLHGTRILTINNGIRQEGQQWGNEHAPEIDTYIADKLSVIKGVEALRYGSDAIGGVVLIDPKPVRSIPGYNGEINSAYATNNQQYVVSGLFEHQPQNFSAFSYRLQGTYKRAANVKTPGYRLNNTGLSEQNFSMTANWKKEHYQLQAYYSQFASQVGIFPGSHIGNLTDLLNVIPQSKPNDIFLGEKTYDIQRPRQEVLHRLFKLRTEFSKNNHRFNFILGGQYNHRDEFNIVRSSSNKRPQVSLALITTSEELTYEHPEFGNLKGTIGISMMQQDNSYSGRYLIPNYTANNYGAYWIEKWSYNKWNIEGGIRFDDRSIATKRLRFNGARVDHDFHFATMGSSLNAGYQLTEALKWNVNASVTTRAPQVNELLVDGIHDASGTYEQGDINLRTEKSFNISSGLAYNSSSKKLSAEIYVYHNRINDFIYQQPKPDDPVLTIVGAFPRIAYQQTNAVLQGADMSVKYLLNTQLQLLSRLSMLRARNVALKDWLILMPADRWRNEVVYTFRDGRRISDAYVSAEVVSTFAPRVPSDDNGKQDYKAPPDAYTLVHMNAAATVQLFGTPVVVGISGRNILDGRYRDYLNSFRYYADEAGRNITLRIKVPFGNLIN